MTFFLYLSIVFCLLNVSVQVSLPADDSYVAAVLEYQNQGTTTINLQNYLQYIQKAAKQNADIVVFPEMTLNSKEDAIADALNVVPADVPEAYSEILVLISEAARQYKIYVVINAEVKVDCAGVHDLLEECPEKKVYIYNTNFVFNRKGKIIDSYRKINLFHEYWHAPGSQDIFGSFQTDFGVTFGHFISFDLKSQVPAMKILDTMKITNIVFPTMWYSELPYLTAVQIQQAFAYVSNVNLLAAGANNVGIGSGGSGIFSGKAGALVSIMPGRPTSQLLVARVPKIPGQVTGHVAGPIYNTPANQESLFLMIDPSLPAHITRELVPGAQEFKLVDRKVTCSFKIEMDVNRNNTTLSYKYRAGVFGGVRINPEAVSHGVRLCSVFACTGDTINTCGTRFPQYKKGATAIFKQLTINAAVPTPAIDDILLARDSIYFPVSADVSIMPLKPDSYDYSESTKGNVTYYSLSLKQFSAELYSFAIWGRSFHADGKSPDTPLEIMTLSRG